jgi:hypothetical protein
VLRVSRQQIVAFRLAALHLDRRLPPDQLVDAARPCGLQDTPPGNAAVAAAARADGVTPDAWTRALGDEKTLVALWAMRGSPVVVATDDLPVFTLGLLPDDEEALLRLLTSEFAPVVAESGVSAGELVERLTERARDALDGRVLTKRELGHALAAAVPDRLASRLAPETAWGSYDALSALALTVARVVSHRGAFLIAPRAGNELSAVRTDQWLGRDPAPMAWEDARAELARRFLRAFAPATAEDFAWWATVHPDAATRRAQEEYARRTWRLIEAELAEVEREEDGSRAFALAADGGRLSSPPTPDGVRLLPPHDPLLMLPDREALVPDVLQGRVWKAQHNPGVVLEGVDAVALWRSRKQGRRLLVSVEPLAGALARGAREAIQAEAERIAPLRGCASADVDVAD